MGYLDDILGGSVADDFSDDVLNDDRCRPDHLVDVLRDTLHEDYADASDEEVEDVLTDMLGTMGPAEALNFSSAISSIGRSAGSLLSDPTVGSIARAGLPVAGGALGAFGGPLGTAVGLRLGGMAAGAIPTRTAAAPSAARPMVATTVPVVPAPVAAPVEPAAVPVAVPAAAPVAAAAAAGSDAAKKALVASRQPEFAQSLLAAAMGQYGRQQVAGVPVAQMLGMLSQLFGQAAADADELMYLSGSTGDAESEGDTDDDLYEALLDVDDLELADAYQGWDVP